MEEKYSCPKMSPKQWIANFWYYYKWLFIVGVIFLTLIVICTVQFVLKVDPDVGVLYVGSYRVGVNDCEKIEEYVKKFAKDINADGKLSASMKAINLHAEFDMLSQAEQIKLMQKYQNYSDEILGGDACILILDEYFYRELAEGGALVNLYGIFEKLPQNAIDFYGLRLRDTKLYQQEGFCNLPRESIVCLKFSGPVSSLSDEEKFDIDYENIEIFRGLIEGN